jgi:class 3 adenylate cyclase
MLSAWDGQRNRDRAVELLKQASPILAELDMQPFLRQAEQLAETLQCELPKSPPSVSRDGQMGMTGARLRVVFFSDMVGSTDMLQRLGDAKAQKVVHAHNAIVRTCLRRHGGVELQHTGDGFMASFASAAGALSCALAIHRAFAKHNQSHAEIPIQVRIGLNAGEPLPEEGRLFGAAVNAAARICAQAQGGEVLVSEAIRQLVAGKDFTFIDRGLFELKGFAEPFRLYAVQGEGA